MIISLDTETTGVDHVHGAMPFLVTWCERSCDPQFVEWDVDPLTRESDVLHDDVQAIIELLDAADLIYLQNAKFDARALRSIGIDLPWAKVRDTLVMGHLLASNHGHRLDQMCVEYLGADIEPLENTIEEVTKLSRTIAKQDYPTWRLAAEGLPEMPSVKKSSKRDEDKPWKNDMWLPRALSRADCKQYIPEHWLTACSKYANGDSEHTLYLGLEMERLIRERGLWAIYMERMKLVRIACEMECYGVTAIGEYTETTIREYGLHIAEAECELVTIAAEYGHDLELAEGAALNDNMRDFFYGSMLQKCPRCTYTKRVKHWNGEREDTNALCPKCLKSSRRKVAASVKLQTVWRSNLALPVMTGKKSGNACLDKDAMQDYLSTVDGTAYDFIKILTDKRKHDTALSYMESYRRFWVPVDGASGYYRVHPSLNPCATDHLRWASNSPNLQNVGKQEQRCEDCDGKGCEVCGNTGLAMLSARNCFGPAPGREWYSIDFDNIEKRIPAYECMEPALIEIFEKAKEPPYWGSDHLLLCSILWPDKFWPLAEKKGAFKDHYINEYKRAKNTNFAKQYGAGKRKVDATAGISGAFDMIDRGMPKLAALQAHYLNFAIKNGYVETLPDKSVDPTRGYPILASRTEDGRVLSTTPFNYHVSGTACWCKNRALVRCSEQLEMWRVEGFDGHIALEIHDEILFDFPRGREVWSNRDRALILKGLMELSGKDIGIPTPVSAEYHAASWARGEPVSAA